MIDRSKTPIDVLKNRVEIANSDVELSGVKHEDGVVTVSHVYREEDTSNLSHEAGAICGSFLQAVNHAEEKGMDTPGCEYWADSLKVKVDVPNLEVGTSQIEYELDAEQLLKDYVGDETGATVQRIAEQIDEQTPVETDVR